MNLEVNETPAKTNANFFLRNFQRTDRIFRFFRKFPAIVRNSVIDQYVRKAKADAKGRDYPERMTLFLTNKCNMKCSHCFIIKEVQPKIEMMTLEEYTKLFRSVRGGVSQVLLTGGEVTLRKDLADIVIAASREGRINTVNIFSNGFRVKDIVGHLTKILENCDININYQTSLDGKKEFHDINRRVPKAFEMSLEAVRQVQELAKKHPGRFSRVIMTTAISKQNLEDLAGICEIIKSSGASPSFCFVRTSDEVYDLKDESLRSGFTPEKTKADGSVKFDDGDYLTVEQMERALGIINDKIWKMDPGSLNYNYNRVTMEAVKESKRTGFSPLSDECRMGFDDVVILADGWVSRCENLNAPVNLRDYDCDLPKMLRSQAWQEFMKKSAGCWCTHDCGIGVSIMKEAPLLKKLVKSGENLTV
ncbi:MAG: radical SAM protein [Bdellovibrionales bacterium]